MDYFNPGRLPDGRLGFVKWCTLSASRISVSLMAYSTQRNQIEILASVAFNLARYSWNPTLESAVISRSDELCSGITLLTRDGLHHFTTLIGKGEKSFRLDEEFKRNVARGCKGTGLADWPAWSPSGDSIAFFASPQSVGLEHFDKPEAPWNLYLMNPDGEKLRELVSEIKHPRALSWSPTGSWLAFSGSVDTRGTGVWIFSLGSGELERVADVSVDWLEWSPEGDRLVGARKSPDSDDPSIYELGLIDLSDNF